MSPMTHVHCAWEYKAQGVTAAQMNLYYGLAVIALDGMAFTEQYREAASRIRPSSTSSAASARTSIPRSRRWAPPFRHAARVNVRTRDGREFEKLPAPPPRQSRAAARARGDRVQVPARREPVPRESRRRSHRRAGREARNAARLVGADRSRRGARHASIDRTLDPDARSDTNRTNKPMPTELAARFAALRLQRHRAALRARR